MLDKKNIYLIAAIVIGLLISWQFTVKNTFDYKRELNTIGIEELDRKSQKLNQLAQQNRLYIKALEEKNISNLETQEALFKSVDKKPSVDIKNYNNEIALKKNNLKTIYHQIELEGTYIDLISSLDEVLRVSPKLQLLHFSFNKKRKNFKSSEKLVLEIILLEQQFLVP